MPNVELIMGLAKMGKLEEALKRINEVRNAQPDALGIEIIEARTREVAGDLIGVREILLVFSSSTEPRTALYGHVGLAKIAVKNGDYETALRHFTAAHNLYPRSPVLCVLLSQIHRRIGNKDVGLKWAQRTVELDPVPPLWQAFLRLAKIDQGSFNPESEGLWPRINQANPSLYWLSTAAAYVLKEGNLGQGVQYLAIMIEAKEVIEMNSLMRDPALERHKEMPKIRDLYAKVDFSCVTTLINP
jgi:tetratricopeptide (TPR) repeat protein